MAKSRLCPCIICSGKWENSQFTDAQKVSLLLSILRQCHVPVSLELPETSASTAKAGEAGAPNVEITPEMVERVAKAIYDCHKTIVPTSSTWEEANKPYQRSAWLKYARAAIDEMQR